MSSETLLSDGDRPNSLRFALLINCFGERSATTVRKNDSGEILSNHLIRFIAKKETADRTAIYKATSSRRTIRELQNNAKMVAISREKMGLAQSSIATRISREIKCGHPVRNISPCSGRRTAGTC